MQTKTQQVIEHLNNHEFLAAMKIAKSFRINFTKDEKSVITRAWEMQNNEGFYAALGFDKFEQETKACEILTSKYSKYLN